MASEVSIRVDTRERVDAPSLARLLMSVNALHVAAAIASGNAATLVAKLRSCGIEGRVELFDAGFDDGDAALFGALAAVNSVGTSEVLRPLRVRELRTGSIETVLEELVESIWHRFRNLVEILPRLTTSGGKAQTDDLIDALAPSVAERQLFASVAGIGYANARVALDQMNASNVEVAARQQATMTASV